MVCLLNEVRMHGASVSGVPIRGVHNLTLIYRDGEFPYLLPYWVPV